MKKQHHWIYIVFIILTIDLLSKIYIQHFFHLYEKKYFCSMINIFYIRNFGAAFSFLANQNGWQRWFLSIISIITIIGFIHIINNLYKNRKKKIFAYSLITGGALGNLIDRIFHGYVIDFIDIHIKNYHFATFNIADLNIFIGSCFLLKKYFYDLQKKNFQKKEE